MMKKQIITNDFEFKYDSDDYGPIYKVTCPKCNCTIDINGPYTGECECGYYWELVAIGKKD